MLTNTLAILAITCSVVAAQPAVDPPPPEQHQAEQDVNRNPEALRKRLLQTLSFAKRIVEKHEAALAQLDAGDDPREIMRSLRSPENRQAMQLGKRMQTRALGQSQSTQDNHTPSPMLTKQELKEVRAFIVEHLPDIDSQLTQVEQMSPMATEKLLARLAPKILEIMRLDDDHSTMSSLKLYELKAGLYYVETARHYRGLLRVDSSDQEALDQAEQRVREAANARFDAQVQIKQYEIHQLSMRMLQLHETLEDLNAQREDQINAQVNAARRTPGPRQNRPVNARTKSDD